MPFSIPYSPNSNKQRLATIGAAVCAVALAGALVLPRMLNRSAASDAPVSAAPVLTVAEGEAGTVGDLTVTSEAIELAEITVAPVRRQVVQEKLALSGVVEAGGDRVARITPRVPGKVARVLSVVGDRVRAGQTLAVIESGELARAQAAYRQAVAGMEVAEKNLRRQRDLARLGSFGRPRVEEARRATVTAQGDAQTARSEVDGARAGVAEAQSRLGTLRAALTQAQAQAKVVRSRLDRAAILYREEIISRQDWEQAQADSERASADVEAARAGVAQGEAAIRTAEAQLATAQARWNAAQKRGGIEAQALAREETVFKGGYATSKEIVEAEAALQQARLDRQAAMQAVRLLGGRPGGGSTVAVTTPIAGRVQERAVTLGETVDTEHSLFTVVDLDEVWAQLVVSPRDLALVRIGERVQLTAETAPGRVFTGRVAAIGTEADKTTRAVPVRVALQNREGALRPGTFVRGGIVTSVRRERIVVPDGAIQEHTGRKTLYVAEGDTPGVFEVRHVKLGAAAGGTGGGSREIVEGLTGNERIAVSGTFYLKSEALKSSLSDGCCAVDVGKD